MNTVLEGQVSLDDAIYHRRAIRTYTSQAVEAATVNKLLHAAVQAPSALNHQPWAFAVLHGRARLQAYSERAKRHLVTTYPFTFELRSRCAQYEDPSYDVFHGAGTLIVIYATSGPLHPNEDCCLAAENMMLEAYALGLGTCPIGFVRPWFDLPETKRELDVPEQYRAVFPLVVGFPDGFTAPSTREEPQILCWKWDIP